MTREGSGEGECRWVGLSHFFCVCRYQSFLGKPTEQINRKETIHEQSIQVEHKATSKTMRPQEVLDMKNIIKHNNTNNIKCHVHHHLQSHVHTTDVWKVAVNLLLSYH